MLRLLAFLLFLPTALLAQGAPRTILVLDGSGSMWGQIDGVNKIVIARKVVDDLLTTLPPEQELGLMSYGHRRKGDCKDIELLIEPGTDRAAISRAVNAINPKGKTPLSAAVLKAAEALRYTEEAATVILISDGIETCNMDPCALGRELEANGVDFTAHVIGFDVAGPEALAQLKCLADETGGLFRTAGNADELADALSQIVAEPEPVRVRFQATDGPGGPVIGDGLVWTIGTDAGPLFENDPSAEPEAMLTATTGTARVIRLEDGAAAEMAFTIAKGDGPQTITLPLPELLPPASVTGPAETPAGSRILVDWTGPDLSRDKVMIVATGGTDEPLEDFAFTSEGTPVRLRVATTPGSYELRYVMNDGNKVLARQPITVTEVGATLDAPGQVPAGTEVSVGWTGPDADRDYIAIVPPGAAQGDRLAYAYTGNGNPARFNAPVEPGDYELLYVLNDNGARAIARRPITVVPASASLNAPASAPAGSDLEVGFTGPMGGGDRIAIAETGADKDSYLDYMPTGRGSPVRLAVPKKPGHYELRYVQRANAVAVLTSQPLEVTAVTATLTAPASARANEEIEVGFTGPANNADQIVIAPPDADTGYNGETGHARNGTPVKLTVPLAAGDWVIRYMLGGRYGEIIAQVPLTVTMPTASLTAPKTLAAGMKFEVAFEAPAFPTDMIVIVPAGGGGTERIATVRPERANPATIEAPKGPGHYDLLYLLGGPYGPALARLPITVE